jgi:glycosyltransferase involved in cell wall biosynthesis
MNDPRPIRVLHLIDGLEGGGCQRWLWDIVRLSAPDAFEHYVLTTHPDTGAYVYAARLRAKGAYHQAASPRLLRSFWRNGEHSMDKRKSIVVRKLSTLLWRIGSFALTVREMPKAVLRFRPDVIHTHTSSVSFATGLMVKAIAGKPLIHTVPALFSQMQGEGLKWMPGMYARLHRFVDRFFTGASYDELISVGIPAAKIIFNRCGVDVEAINELRNVRDRYRTEIRKSLRLSDDAFLALSVGRLHSSKGHLFALKSLPTLLRRFPNLHWVVLGEGPQRVELEAQASELGVAEHVHLIGFQPEPLPYYAAADIYLRTPVFEAENLCSYQAIVMGLPVVGFDTGCETELIDKVGNGILVPNRDEAGLAQAVESILMLPDKGQAKGELGAQYGRGHLDLRQTTSQFFSVYANGHSSVAELSDKEPVY